MISKFVTGSIRGFAVWFVKLTGDEALRQSRSVELLLFASLELIRHARDSEIFDSIKTHSHIFQNTLKSQDFTHS